MGGLPMPVLVRYGSLDTDNIGQRLNLVQKQLFETGNLIKNHVQVIKQLLASKED